MPRKVLVVDRSARDLEMMKSPDRWPAWPRLPLKRRTAPMELGFLMADGTPTVHQGNIFESIQKATPKTYASFEAVVNDGWVVD